MQLKNNRINQTIETTLKNLSEIIDVNTAIGTPINTKDGIIIPSFPQLDINDICPY